MLKILWLCFFCGHSVYIFTHHNMIESNKQTKRTAKSNKKTKEKQQQWHKLRKFT